MKTVDYYIDLAITTRRLSSDRELCRELGLSWSAVNHWRTRRYWPDDDTMIALAELGGADPQAALLDLNAWRSKSQKARELYSRLAGELARAIIIAAFALPLLGTAWAHTENGSTSTLPVVYIMR